MTTVKQVIYNGVLFTIKNTVPELSETEKAVKLRDLSNDFKRTLDRLSKLNKSEER